MQKLVQQIIRIMYIILFSLFCLLNNIMFEPVVRYTIMTYYIIVYNTLLTIDQKQFKYSRNIIICLPTIGFSVFINYAYTR